MATGETGRQGLHLLKLPAELRIWIYEYALIEKTIIAVIRSFKQPGLLSTCRQIRKEAAQTWYQSNKFVAVVKDCDTSLYRGFVLHLRQVTSYRVAFTSTFRISPNFYTSVSLWTNLEDHCRAVWTSPQVLFPVPTVEKRGLGLKEYYAVFECAQRIAFRANKRGVPWEECKEQLRALREVAGFVNDLWRV